MYFNPRLLKKFTRLKIYCRRVSKITQGQNMHLGYITMYEADVPENVVFYETAFALKRPFVH